MAIAFVAATGSANGTDTESGTISVAMPSSTVGHCVVLSVGVQLNKTVTTPAGWTLVRSQVNGTITGYQFVRVLTGGEPSTLSVTTSSSSLGGCYWSAAAYSGVSSGVPINISGSGTAGSGASPTCSLTTTVTNCQIVAFEFAFGSGGTTNTITSSYTMRTANNATSTNGLLGGTGDKPAATASTFTATGNAYSSISVIAAVALQPTSPPAAPTLTAPVNASYQDLAAGYTFTWTHSGTYTGGTQTQYAIRRKISGAGSYEYWNAGTNAWQSTLIYNVSTSSSLTFGAALWTDGNIYNWSASTKDGGGTSPFATDNTVTASAAPTAVVTAPTGTITTAAPTATWTETLQSGASQTAYRVVVESGSYGTSPGLGTSVWDSGVVSSAALSVTVGGTLANSTTFRVFVQITETGGQTSTWGYSTFTTNYTPPATPGLTATWDATHAQTTLTVTAGGGSPTPTYYLVERSNDGGTTWTTVRAATQLIDPGSGTMTAADPEAPPNITVQYRARAVAVLSGVPVPSANSTVRSVTSTITRTWLKDPLNPALNIAVYTPRGDRQTTQDTTGTAYYALGRANAVVISDTLHSAAGTLSVTAKDATSRDAALTLMTSQRTLLLQKIDGDNRYIQITGQVSLTRRAGSDATYVLNATYVTVDSP